MACIKNKNAHQLPPMPDKVDSTSSVWMISLRNLSMLTTFLRSVYSSRSDLLIIHTYRAACFGCFRALAMTACFLASRKIVTLEPVAVDAQSSIACTSSGCLCRADTLMYTDFLILTHGLYLKHAPISPPVLKQSICMMKKPPIDA